MKKTKSTAGRAKVKFTLQPAVGAVTASIHGDWNGWSSDGSAMKRDRQGGFSTTLELEVGRAYRFRYLLDGERWENDWNADAYLPNDFGAEDSIVDLTSFVIETPARRPTKKAPTDGARGEAGPSGAPSSAKRAPRAARAPRASATSGTGEATEPAGGEAKAARRTRKPPQPPA